MTIDTYLHAICQHCGLDENEVSVETKEENDDKIAVQLTIPDDDVGLFIGHRGETLAALQRMVRIVFQKEFADRRLTLNINTYRQDRLEQLQTKAREVAGMVLESGREYRFPFLSSYERYIIHSAISSDPELAQVESFSEGEGQDRRLVVRPRTQQS